VFLGTHLVKASAGVRAPVRTSARSRAVLDHSGQAVFPACLGRSTCAYPACDLVLALLGLQFVRLVLKSVVTDAAWIRAVQSCSSPL
jgi:hypothetical protein